MASLMAWWRWGIELTIENVYLAEIDGRGIVLFISHISSPRRQLPFSIKLPKSNPA
jgi:hypothetical protein